MNSPPLERRGSMGPWVKLAWSVWIGLVVGFALYGYFFPRTHTVFHVYARAARNWWTRQNLYVAPPGEEPYRYSPSFAVAFSPFILLQEPFGNACWRLVNCLIYAGALAVWAGRVLLQPNEKWLAGVFLLLVLPLSLHSMYNAQANLLMVGLILLGLTALTAECWNRAAVALAAATVIKGYPLALALLVAAVYPRRFLMRYLAALSLCLLLPVLAGSPSRVFEQYQNWLGHLCYSTTAMRERLRTLEHLTAIYGFPVEPRAFMLIQLMAGLGALAILWRHCHLAPETRTTVRLAYTLFALWTILFGPATEACTYVVAAPVIAGSLVDGFQGTVSSWRRWVLVASLLLMGPCGSGIFGDTIRNFANEHGSQPIGALLLAAAMLLEMLRCRAAPLCQQSRGHWHTAAG